MLTLTTTATRARLIRARSTRTARPPGPSALRPPVRAGRPALATPAAPPRRRPPAGSHHWVAPFTGARGVAAFVVVVHHVLLTRPEFADLYFHRTAAPAGSVGWWATATPLYLAWAGKEAVLVFFVLSGVVLALSATSPAGAALTATVGVDLREFYPRRLVRLYVPVWASIALAWAWAVVVPRDWAPGTSWWLVEENPAPSLAGTVQDALLVGAPGSTNHVLWSLQWEVLYCLLLPLALPALRAAPRWWTAKAAAAVAAFGFALDQDNLAVTALSVLALGTLIALEAPRLAGWAAVLDCSPRPAAAWTAVLLVAVALLLSYRLVVLVPVPVLQVPAVTRVPQVLGACLLIFLAWHWAAAHRVLSTTVLQWLGVRSYSLYLVHLPIVAVVAAVLGPRPDLAAVTTWALALTLPATELFFRAVERPSHRLARRLGHRLRAHTALGTPGVAAGCTSPPAAVASTAVPLTGLPPALPTAAVSPIRLDDEVDLDRGLHVDGVRIDLLPQVRAAVRAARRLYDGTGPTARLVATLETRLDGAADTLAARSALVKLETLVRVQPPPGRAGRQLAHRLERIRTGSRELAELELLDGLRGRHLTVPDALRAAAARLFGAAGPDPRARLGLPEHTTTAEVLAAVAAQRRRWELLAAHAGTSRHLRDIATTAADRCTRIAEEVDRVSGGRLRPPPTAPTG